MSVWQNQLPLSSHHITSYHIVEAIHICGMVNIEWHEADAAAAAEAVFRYV